MKGKQVYVEGQPEARSFQRNDGTPGASLSLRVRNVQLLGGRGEAGTGNGGYQSAGLGQSATSSSTDASEDVDDLPF